MHFNYYEILLLRVFLGKMSYVGVSWGEISGECPGRTSTGSVRFLLI